MKPVNTTNVIRKIMGNKVPNKIAKDRHGRNEWDGEVTGVSMSEFAEYSMRTGAKSAEDKIIGVKKEREQAGLVRKLFKDKV